MAKRLTLLLTVALLVVFTAGVVWGVKQDPRLTTPTSLKDGSESFDYLMSTASGVFLQGYCGETTILSPYDTCIGCTWYDYQHNSRIPRMVANDYQDIGSVHGRHYTFMHLDLAPGPDAKRYVNYTYWDETDGWTTLPAPTITAQGNYTGYTGLAVTRDSRAVVIYHATQPIYPNDDDQGVTISIEPSVPGAIDFAGAKYWYDIPDSAGTDFKGMWPAGAVDGLGQIHMIFYEGDTAAGWSWMAYVRCAERPDDKLMCQCPGADSATLDKETQYFDPIGTAETFDSSGVISGFVATSKVSNKVAIVYPSLAEAETDSTLYQLSNDCYYIESTNGGDDWFSDPALLKSRRNCSNYGVDDLLRVYGEITAVYDFNDNLHIFWHTHKYDQEAAEVDINDVALWHFSEGTIRICGGDSVYANKIHAANWEDATAGAWNRLISKIGCGVGIKEGDNKNHLYANWTQFDTNTYNDAGNLSQGDLYVSASTDAGMTWMIPVNFTSSTQDSCAVGECASDHWGSMAERVDDSLYFQWIYDRDAGGVVQDEGEPTNNPVLVYALAKEEIPLENKARIGWAPSDFISPYVHTPTEGRDTVTLSIENIGTATLSNIQLTETAGWMNVTPSNIASIAAGGCPVNVEVEVIGQGSEEFYVDSIHVTSNDQAGNNDFYVRLHVVMSDVYVRPDFVTLTNPTMWVNVSNLGNLGNQVDTAGYYLHQDANEPSLLYDASVLLAFTAPNTDSVVGRHIFNERYLLPESDLNVTDVSGIKTKIAVGEYAPTTPQAPLPWHHRWWYWTILTKDYIFYSESSTDNKEQYVTLRYIKLYYNDPPPWWPDITPPATVPVAYLGMGLDIDAPSDSGSWNHPGQDELRRLAYLRGYGGGANENYRMGIAQRDTCFWAPLPAGGTILACWPDPSTIPSVDQPFAMHILRNDSTVYPYGGYDDTDLYKWMSTPGDSIQRDTLGAIVPEDHNIVTTGRVIPAGSFPFADTARVAYAMVVSDEFDIDHMNSCIDMLKCGNANRDNAVTIADVVYLVSFLLKSGAEPFTFMSDADGNGLVAIADAVWLVNYLFRSGPPPKCSSDW